MGQETEGWGKCGQQPSLWFSQDEIKNGGATSIELANFNDAQSLEHRVLFWLCSIWSLGN